MNIEHLQDEMQFEKIRELHHDEVIPFVQELFQERGPTIQLFITLNIALLLGLLVLAIFQIIMGYLGFWTILQFVGLGILLTMTVLIPVHEAIHGLAYKYLGAPKVSFGANIRKLYFYAAADQFVINGKQFKIIALAPFVLITVVAILLSFWVSPQFQWTILGILLMHTTACSGDFAMLAYLEKFDRTSIYTYDNVKSKISYFYKKRNAE